MRSAEFVSGHELYRQFQDSEYYRDDASYLEMLQSMARFLQSLNLAPEARRVAIKKLGARIRPDMREHG